MPSYASGTSESVFFTYAASLFVWLTIKAIGLINEIEFRKNIKLQRIHRITS